MPLKRYLLGAMFFILTALVGILSLTSNVTSETFNFNSTVPPTPTTTSFTNEIVSLVEEPFDSPLPTPSPTPISHEATLVKEFVSNQTGIPLEKLQIGGEETVNFPMLGQSYRYVTVFDPDSDPFHMFSLLVNIQTGEIEEDLNLVRANEEAAYRQHYGKFTPQLYERLEIITEDVLLPIAIWVAQAEGEPTEVDLYQELATRYPNINDTVAEQGVPWAVEDQQLAQEIAEEYHSLLSSYVSRRVQPLVEWLYSQGYTVEEFPGMPALAATLSRQTITELGKRDDVSNIYLLERNEDTASDIAIPTDRTPIVWSNGVNGSGIRVGIVESGTINSTAASCLNIVNTRSAGSINPHKSRVAAIVACNNTSLRGLAFGAQIIDAGHNGSQNDAIATLMWATDTGSAIYANVTNHSGAFEDDTLLNLTDRAYDYWVRQRKFTAVIAAGNTGNGTGYVTSPAKAYNVITVGNFNDMNTSSWSDDSMWASSAWINPISLVEKPEVAAPGRLIETVVSTTNDNEKTGTSFAAPQVAGLAASLMQRHATLKTWPSVVKAIVMASAIHNIEGVARLSDRDGAGAIDAALADQIAQTQGGAGTCSLPCWWNVNTSSTVPSVNNYISRYFHASRGERIRVAISWLAQGDSNYTSSTLLTNYDLNVRAPSGSLTVSTSSFNNFEIVDFIAPDSGEYEIRVYRNSSGDSNESGNFLGIAWVKLGTYLPDVRQNNDGWTSKIYIRNDGAEPWTGKITYFNQTGSYANEQTTTIQPAAVWSGATPPSNWRGTAIVSGNDDISVVIRNDKSGLSTLDNGIATGGATDPAWGLVSHNLYAPAIYHNAFGAYSSDLNFQNGVPGVTAQPNLYARSGSGFSDVSPSGLIMGFNNQQAIPLSSWTPSGWLGSLRTSMSPSVPIALRIYEARTGEGRSYNATATGRNILYMPVAYKNYYGFNSGVVIQNLHTSNSTNVTLNLCTRNVSSCLPHVVSVNPLRAVGVNLASLSLTPPWTGSISFQSNNGAPLSVLVNNTYTGVGGYSVSGVGYGSRLIILPWAAKNSGGRTTGYTVRNVSGLNNVTVKAHYYNANGTFHSTFNLPTLHSAWTDGYFQANDTFLSNGWEGSIVLEASANIVAVMREDTATTTAGYNGIAR